MIETVAALAIAGTALLALLQLHLVSLRTADKAQILTQAVFLAQEKMAEVLGSGYPPVGVRSGVVDAEGDRLTWRTEVTEAPLPVVTSRKRAASPRLRKLSVDVTWQTGPGERSIRVTTYVAENKIRAA